MAAKIVLWLLFAHYMFMKCTAKKSWRRDNKWCTMPMSLQCWFENGFKSRFLCKRFWECGVTTNDTPYRVHHWQRGHDPISFFWFWVFPSTVPYQVMKTDCRESGFENSDIVVALQGVLISRTSGCWPSRKKNLLCLCICLCLSVCLCLFSTHMVGVLGWKELCSYFHCRQICLQLARPRAQGRRRRALISNGANFCAFSHFSPRPPESFSQKCNSVKSKHFCLMKGNNVLCWRHQGVFDSWFCLNCKQAMFAQCKLSFNSTQSQLSYTLWDLQK